MAVGFASFWRSKTCFVAGATGFVGAHVTRQLAEQEVKVIGLQVDSVKSNSLDLFDIRSRVTVINGQFEDFALMERIINTRSKPCFT